MVAQYEEAISSGRCPLKVVAVTVKRYRSYQRQGDSAKDPKVSRKDRKVSQQTLDFRAECAAAGACTTYNHYRREGKTDDEAKAICRGYYGKTREDQYILVESVKRSIAAKEKSETGDLDPSPSPPVASKNDTASP